MVLFLFSILMYFPTFGEAPTLTSTDAGVELLKNQKYAEAYDYFKQQYDQGLLDARLFYNWGQASYRLQKKGMALALWRRALNLAPDFRGAHLAIQFVNDELPKNIDKGDSSLILWIQKNVLDFISWNLFLFAIWLVLLISSFLILRYYGLRKYATDNNQPSPSLPLSGIALSILLALLFFLASLKIILSFESHATVIKADVNLRTGPSTNDNSVMSILEGTDVEIDQVSNDWVLVSIDSSTSGWVQTSELFQHSGVKKLW
ncbi:MAG: SH3 domain-containing protein [Bdellovibrionales bacterium]